MPLKKNTGRSTLRKSLAGFAGGASEAALLQAFLGEEGGGGFSAPELLHNTPLPEEEEEELSIEELLRQMIQQGSFRRDQSGGF